MRVTGRHYFNKGVKTFDDKPRKLWIFDYPAQTALCGIQIWWTSETNDTFAQMELGHENALKEFNKKQVRSMSLHTRAFCFVRNVTILFILEFTSVIQITQLNELIDLLLGDLTKGERQKVNTICTIDVHCRDVVSKMILQKVEMASAFQWQSQLRHR